MGKTFHFQIATADGAVVDEQVTYASVPLVDGECGIMADHAAMLAALKEGVIHYKGEGLDDYAAVSGGVLSVADNEVIILARSAEKAENIDLARAQAAEKRARDRMENKKENLDMHRTESSLHRALAREKAYSYLHK